MELALNLVWAILAATSYAALIRNLTRQGAKAARGLSPSQCLIALTCVLAILFPVISLTDDLHEMQATAEEASPSGLIIKRCAARQAPSCERYRHRIVTNFTAAASMSRWAAAGPVAQQETIFQIPFQKGLLVNRGPPPHAIAPLA